jgi:hypothetical protein
VKKNKKNNYWKWYVRPNVYIFIGKKRIFKISYHKFWSKGVKRK